MAANYIKKAEKELKKWGFFSSSKYENAGEFFRKAATEYKKEKDWDAAGVCFVKAAECFEKVEGEDISASQCYKDAGQSFKKTDIGQAAECYHKAAAYYQAKNSFNRAAKLFDEIAVEYQKDNQVDLAIEFYTLAIENFEGADDASSANRKYLEIAHMEAARGNFDIAIQHYETNARAGVDSNLLRWGVKDHLFRASLCQLCVSAKNDTFGECLEHHERYMLMSDIYNGTREQKLISALIDACMAGNMADYATHVQAFDEMTRIDDWKMNLLVYVKDTMEGISQNRKGNDDDDDFESRLNNNAAQPQVAAGNDNDDDFENFL